MKLEYQSYCGCSGDNLSKEVVVIIEEGLRDKSIYLEFEKPNGKKYASELLTLDEEGKAVYSLQKTLLDEVGYLKIQIIAKDGDFTEKSIIYKFYVAESINATDEVVEDEPDLLGSILKEIKAVESEVHKITGVDGGHLATDKDIENLQNQIKELKVEETDPTVPECVKSITPEDIAKWNEGGSGGTKITDTLTLSKEVVIPEVPAGKVEMVSIENLSTEFGFELNENGYYESTNKFIDNRESYALCKFTFTLPKTMNVVFDVINYAEQGWDYGIFSNLDTELTNNFSGDDNNNVTAVYKSFKQESSPDVVQLVYKNVPAGEHFITIKYVKDGGGNNYNDSVQFKLNDELNSFPITPEKRYTSEQSITIGDENNLQIEGKDILKEGDVSFPVKEIEGTGANPIVLFDLPKGFYKIKGKFKTLKTNPTWDILNYNQITQQNEEGSEALIQVIYKEEDITEFLIYNAEWFGNEIMLGTGASRTNNIFSRGWIWANGGVGYQNISTDGFASNSYVETEFKKVNVKIDSIEHISSLDNPKEATSPEYENNFMASTDMNDDSLYFGKKVGESTQLLIPELNKNIAHFYIKKDLVTTEFPYLDGGNNPCWLALKQNETDYINWTGLTANYSNGYVSYLADSWGNIIYTTEGGWTELSGNTDELYDLTQHFQEKYDPLVTYIEITEWYHQDARPYYVSQEIAPIVEPKQLALKKDLEGLGGETPVFEETSRKVFKLFNDNTLKNGIYLCKAGGEVYYGHSGYQTQTNYMVSLPNGSIVVYQRTIDWTSGNGSASFQVIAGGKIYTGTTNYYNSGCQNFTLASKYNSSGVSTNGFIAKITDANGTMNWVKPDYYTKTEIDTKLEDVGGGSGGSGGTAYYKINQTETIDSGTAIIMLNNKPAEIDNFKTIMLGITLNGNGGGYAYSTATMFRKMEETSGVYSSMTGATFCYYDGTYSGQCLIQYSGGAFLIQGVKMYNNGQEMTAKSVTIENIMITY